MKVGSSWEDVLCQSMRIVDIDQFTSGLRLIWSPPLVGDGDGGSRLRKKV